jgi:hypothetical protein
VDEHGDQRLQRREGTLLVSNHATHAAVTDSAVFDVFVNDRARTLFPIGVSPLRRVLPANNPHERRMADIRAYNSAATATADSAAARSGVSFESL